MAFIYAFRLGRDDVFKIGKTSSTLDGRRRALQTGCPRTLSVFDYIETDSAAAASEGEAYIKRQFADHLLHPRREMYRFTPDEAHEALAVARRFVEVELPAQRADRAQVAELRAVEPSPDILPATDETTATYRRILEIDTETARLETKVSRLKAEKERLLTAIMLAIGTSSGIEGVATWSITTSRRAFKPDLLRTADPELYQRYSTLFDSRRFKADRPKE